MTPKECKAKKMDNQKRTCRNKRSGAEALEHVKAKMRTEITGKTTQVQKTGWNNRLLAATWEAHIDEYNVLYVTRHTSSHTAQVTHSNAFLIN